MLYRPGTNAQAAASTSVPKSTVPTGDSSEPTENLSEAPDDSSEVDEPAKNTTSEKDSPGDTSEPSSRRGLAGRP